MGSEGKIILDNGGGITLQMGEFAHYYDDPKHAARDLADWLEDADTSTWDGHEEEAAECSPTGDDIRNGGYRVIRLDRDVDTLESLSQETKAVGWGNAGDMSDALARLHAKKAV